MKKFAALFLGLSSLVFACVPESTPTLLDGRYRAELDAQGHSLPFIFEVTTENNKQVLYLVNAGERLAVEDWVYQNDSVLIDLHVFDASIRAKLEGDRLEGEWTKNYYEEGYALAFEAVLSDEPRFVPTQGPAALKNSVDGRWEIIFETDGPEKPAVGEFVQQGNRVTGTILTRTGDYRFLEGIVDGGRLKLSTFDGEHAFLFEADFTEEGNLEGEFWSGKHWHETFSATPNEEATLPDPSTLTYLKEGYEGIEFSFPGLDGEPVTLNDEQFQDKVVLLQIFGTWCPNCMDETRFLADWYREQSAEDVAILGLSYEQKDDFDYAVKRINRVKENLAADYDFVVAGTSDKAEASKTLPMLNEILAFPTLIILDRDQQIRRIHTGFNGPGTGVHYTRFVEEFELFMDKLLNE